MLLQAYKGVVTIRGLADTMGVDKPALTRGADILENLGLLQREEEQGDRRSVVLVITAAGRRAVEKLAGI